MFFFFQAEDGIRDLTVTGVQTCALPILAVTLGAQRCEFYKDVDGIYTKDPKQHQDAQKMERCDYDRVLALANSGAKVLHSEAILLAQKHSMPLYIASSFTASNVSGLVK